MNKETLRNILQEVYQTKDLTTCYSRMTPKIKQDATAKVFFGTPSDRVAVVLEKKKEVPVTA